MSTFLDVVELLISNDEAKTSYADNPTAFLEEHGLDALDPTDVADAMQYAGDALPLPVAVLIDPESGLDSAAAIDLEAQGLSLEREPFVEDPTMALDEDVPFDHVSDVPAEDVVDLLDALDTPLAGGDPALLDEAPRAADNPAELAEATEELDDQITEDTGDYLTDTTQTNGSAEVPFDDYEADTVLDNLDAEDVHDQLPEDFDLLD